MSKSTRPNLDMNAFRDGDQKAFALIMAALAEKLFRTANSSIKFKQLASDLAVRGNSSEFGLLAAAIDLRDLLTQCPQGREALREFGFEQVCSQPTSMQEPNEFAGLPPVVVDEIKRSRELKKSHRSSADLLSEPASLPSPGPDMQQQKHSEALRLLALTAAFLSKEFEPAVPQG